MTKLAAGLPAIPRLRWILLLAVVVRAAFPLSVLAVHGDPGVFTQLDSGSYVRPAESLVEHGRFTTPGGSPEIQRTPGYPLLLTLGVLAGRITLVTIAAQVLLGIATVLGVALLARRVLPDSRAARWAAAFCALDPLSVMYPSLLMTETLFAAVFVAHLYALLRFLQDPRGLARPAVAGGLAAAATLVRPIAYYWPFVAVATAAWILGRRGLRGCAVFLVAALLPCALWQVRNGVQTGYYGLSTISAVNLYAYNASGVVAKNEGIPMDEARARLYARVDALEEAGELPTRAARAEYMAREGRRIILEQPLAYLGVHLRGIVQLFVDPGFTGYLELYGRPPLGGLATALDQGLGTALARLWREHGWLLVASLAFWAILAAQLAGAAVGAVRVRRVAVAAVLFATVAYFALVSGGPAAYSRFRHPMMPAVCVLMGLAFTPQRRLPAAASVGRSEFGGSHASRR